jgi:hypothetical protein
VREKARTLNFTKRGLEAIASDPHKRLTVHDAITPGLTLRIHQSGKKNFCWFRKVAGRPTWKNIGGFPELSIENARTKAQEYNSKFARWRADEYETRNPFERKVDLTLQQVVDDYCARRLATHARKPAKAIAGVSWQVGKYLSDWLPRKIQTLHPEDILKRHADIGQQHGATTANVQIRLLRTLFH